MRLRHLHLTKPITYSYSLQLQEAVLARHFNYKFIATARQKTYALGDQKELDDRGTENPAATLLTFQTQPTYTVGRRHLKSNPLSPSQIKFLTSTSSARLSAPLHDIHESGQTPNLGELATFYPSPRGGLLTYHGPGQLTAYLIYNLRHHDITPRCHVRILENAVMKTCAVHGVPNTTTTEDPGVWISGTKPYMKTNPASNSMTDAEASSTWLLQQDLADAENLKALDKDSNHIIATNRKICAIGVHVSRGVTSHGIGLNIFDSPIPSLMKDLYKLPITTPPSASTSPSSSSSSPSSLGKDGNLGRDMSMFQPPESTTSAPGYLSWGFGRIIACGLEGKSVTWLTRERPNPTQERTNHNIAHKEPHTSPPSVASISVQSTPSPAHAVADDPSPNIMEQIASTLSDELCKALTAKGKITMDGVQRVSEEQILSFRSTAKPA